MKTEINPNTLMCQIIDAEQMVKRVTDRDLYILINELELIKREADLLKKDSPIGRKIWANIDRLEVATNNKLTQINLKHHEEMEREYERDSKD